MMRQGEIWEIFLDSFMGSEQGDRRPAVIISGNTMNEYLNTVIVCPLTSKVRNYKGNPVLKPEDFTGLQIKSEILVFQIRNISKERLKRKLGVISPHTLNEIKETINDLLKF